MNTLIQQILSKKTLNDTKTILSIKTIEKPIVVGSGASAITVDNDILFYTFDGRALFFSETQKEPVISVPEETKQVIFEQENEKVYTFTLNAKNKLECSNFTESFSTIRYTVTRNVLQIQKTERKVYFIFKKDQFYYINECVFDGKKWVGKIVCTNISGNDVLLHCTGGEVLYTIDALLFDVNGKSLGLKADFVHNYEGLFVIGNKKSNYYELKILEKLADVSPCDLFALKCKNIEKIEAHTDTLIIKCTEGVFIFRIDSKDKNFSLKYQLKNYDPKITNFDFEVRNNTVSLYILSNSKHEAVITEITGSNIDSYEFEKHPVSLYDDNFLEEDITQKSFSEDAVKQCAETEESHEEEASNPNNSDFFYENVPVKKSSILKEMESLSIAPSSKNTTSIAKQKNNLLEEVRATLNKKKLEPLSQPVDRFELFRSAAQESSKGEQSVSETAKIPEEKVQKKSQSNQLKPEFQTKVEDSLLKENNASMQCTGNPDVYLSKMNAYHKETLAAIESISTLDKANVKKSIKESIIEALVPCVEACFNEMRIQILTEVTRMLSNVTVGCDQKINAIKKLLQTGKSTQAILEFLKLEESEMQSNLAILTPNTLESADSTAIYQLFVKIYALSQKAPNDTNISLLNACLMDIEIGALSTDNLQDLSVLLRIIKDNEQFNKTEWKELQFLVDIIIKKIRKRVQYTSSK
ncbi:hypothetical protein GINT2_000409 [Glugoides intestinalis]